MNADQLNDRVEEFQDLVTTSSLTIETSQTS